jgi:hypothetical protein
VKACGVTELSGFSPRSLLPNLPMLERIDMATARASPCTLLRIGIPLVDHLDDQMTMETHRWLAVHVLVFDSLSHGRTPFFSKFVVALAIRLPGSRCLQINKNAAFQLDAGLRNRVEIPSRGEK